MSARQTAVLLALDETLVLVGGLQLLRKRKNWPKVYAGFPQTELPPGTLAFIARLKALADVQLGVVTKSPRTYAERLLRFHTLEVPVLIAYHDVTRHKPHPNALIKADERLNIALERRVYNWRPPRRCRRRCGPLHGSDRRLEDGRRAQCRCRWGNLRILGCRISSCDSYH